jgi:uncharacterized protein YabE (DUF348 family)
VNEHPDNVGGEVATASTELTAAASATEKVDTHSDITDAETTTGSTSPAESTTGPAEGPTRRSGVRRKALLVAAAATIGLLAVGGGTAASLAKSVTITVDGEQREVTTLAASVEGALSSAGLQAGEHDVVAPAPDAQISDGAQIAVERGRLLSLTINGQTRDIWTTADTLNDALLQLGQDPSALALSADRDREIPLDGLEVTANALRTISLSVAGAPAAQVQTGALTVGDLLVEQGLTLSATDSVTPAVTTPVTDGLPVVVTVITVTSSTATVDVAPTDQLIDDPNLNKGTTVVAAAGVPGKQEVVTEVTTTNGVETGRRELSRVTITEPTANQVQVGTKAGYEVRGSRVFFNDTEFGVNWDGLAFCESTNNPHAVNNPSGFLSTYGLFQFDLPTWASVGGSGNPGDAAPDEQLLRAKLLYQSRGLQPWLCGYAASGPPPA